MTLEEANNELQRITQGMAYIEFISYAAVIADPLNANNYTIEYGIIDNDLSRYTHGAKNKNHVFANALDNEKYDIKTTKKIIENPIKSGHSIGSDSAYNTGGTIGAFFKLQNDKHIYGITNQHVIGNRKTHIHPNKLVHHPAVIHTESNNFKSTKPIGNIQTLYHNTAMDLGIIKLHKESEHLISGGNPKDNISYKGIAKPKLNTTVCKYGTSTGFTEGKIISTNASCKVHYDHYNTKGYVIMTQQIMTEEMISDSGDSGAIVYDKNYNVVGLLFGRHKLAKRSFFTDINTIFNTRNGNNIEDKPPYLLDHFI